MFVTPEGKEIFVVDGHTHFWDGSPENQANIHGKQFIDCFYAYHSGLSPKEQLWEKSKFEKYTEADLTRIKVTEDFSDFKKFEGFTVPHKYKITYSITGANTNEITYTSNLSEFAVNQALDPASFEIGK